MCGCLFFGFPYSHQKIICFYFLTSYQFTHTHDSEVFSKFQSHEKSLTINIH